MQRLIERQCVIEPTAIIGHARSVKLLARIAAKRVAADFSPAMSAGKVRSRAVAEIESRTRSEEHTSELQSPCNLVCRLLLEKKKTTPTRARRSDVNPSIQ